MCRTLKMYPSLEISHEKQGIYIQLVKIPPERVIPLLSLQLAVLSQQAVRIILKYFCKDYWKYICSRISFIYFKYSYSLIQFAFLVCCVFVFIRFWNFWRNFFMYIYVRYTNYNLSAHLFYVIMPAFFVVHAKRWPNC